MARQVRIEYEGAFYHVMARGDRREAIVRSEKDRSDFVETMGRACERTGWRVHGWVLMTNHYHWLIETPRANLVDGMRWFQNTYTRRFNVRNGQWGHVFGGRYKAVVLDAWEGNGFYFETLLDYIHLNPVRAGLVDVDEGNGILDYQWSSLRQSYAVAPSDRPSWVEVSNGLGVKQRADTVSGRREYVEALEQRARAEGERAGIPELGQQSLQSTLRRGWYWGGQALKEKLLKTNVGSTGESNRDYRLSDQGRERVEDRAEKLVVEVLDDVGLRECDLAMLKGSDPRKVEVAARLCDKTTVSQAWIARRLHMRSAGNVSQQLYRQRRREEACKE